ncbi:hypothetical protein HA402_014297 [Bradysia odoriphaga]|nr:hypothetical protein HA402_014297 [Bradysia odoriphaga]
MKRDHDEVGQEENEEEESNENIGEADGNTSVPKKKKRHSPIWKHYTIKLGDDGTTEFGHCNYCAKAYKLSGKTNGSTGNLNSHLKKDHPDRADITSGPVDETFVFSQEAYRKALVEWILMSNQPFTECEEEYFLKMIKTLNPTATTISDQTVKRDIMKLFEERIVVIKSILSKVPGKLSFTIDAWTSKNVIAFMAIRAHWIDEDWAYQSLIVDFSYIEGKHSGQNLCKHFVDCLNRFDIPFSKIMAVTMDNVYSNNTFMDFLKKHGINAGINITASDNRVRCMPHILNLAVQTLFAELKIPLNNETDEWGHLDNLNFNGVETLSSADEQNDEYDDDEGEIPTDHDVEKSTVSKLRSLIKKVRKSCQMREKLWKLCQFYDITHLVPIIDVKTRWNSTFEMIERAANLKTPLRALCSNEKTLKSLLMTESEFAELEVLQTLLQKFHRSTKLMSMERHPTICAYLPTLDWLLESLKSFIKDNSGALSFAAQKSLEKLEEYETQLQLQSSKLPFVGVFLNPALKLNFFKEHNYSKSSIREIQNVICERLEADYKDETEDNSQDNSNEESDEFFSFMFKRAKSYKEPKEFKKYLSFPLSTPEVDVLEYWRCQQTELPQMARFARDVLPVQGSSVAVERDFSMGADLIVPTRCRLKRETIRAIMCLKSWFKSSLPKTHPNLTQFSTANTKHRLNNFSLGNLDPNHFSYTVTKYVIEQEQSMM